MGYFVITYDVPTETTYDGNDYRERIIRFILTNGGGNLKYVMKTTITFTSNRSFTGEGNWMELFRTLIDEIHYYAAKISMDDNNRAIQDKHYPDNNEINSFNEIRDRILEEINI